MDSGGLIVTDEQAKALQEAFKLGGKGLDLAKALGSYLAQVLGSTPADVVGLLGGDWIRVRRAENLVLTMQRARERLQERGVEPEPAPLALAIPLLEGAADENREELVDAWARLLAAAMDPSRAKRVRQAFIETVRKLDPIDAVILRRVPEIRRKRDSAENAHVIAAGLFGISIEEADVALQHLFDLGCVRDLDQHPGDRGVHIGRVVLTTYGVELLRVLEDDPKAVS